MYTQLSDYYNYLKTINHDANTTNLHVHHIIPRSLGGLDEQDNLIRLTPSEHIKAHDLLYRAFLNMTQVLGYTVICMAKDSKNLKRIYDDMQSYDDALEYAHHLSRIRIVLDKKTLSKRRIRYFDDLPDDCVEYPKSAAKKQYIYNAELKIRRKWPIDIPLPSEEWSTVNYTSNTTQRTAKKPNDTKCRYIHNIQTLKNTKIPINAVLPEGFEEGFYVSAETRKKLSDAAIRENNNRRLANPDGYRAIYDISTLKNKVIPKNMPLPEGYAEGYYLSEAAKLKHREACIKAAKVYDPA